MDLNLYNKWLDQAKRSLPGFSTQDVEEAFNDALLLIHQQGKVFTNEAHAYSFIKTTTRNKTMNKYTNNSTVIRKNTKLLDTLKVVTYTENALDVLLKKEQLDIQKKIVYKNTDAKQTKIVTELMKDCDRKYVADKLNIKENTINSQIRHIKHKIGAAW